MERRSPWEYDAYFLDVDGVIYREGRVLPHAVESVQRLISQGKRVVFTSNTSIRSQASLTTRLQGIGIDVAERFVLAGTALTAEVVAERWPEATVHVLGGQDLATELRRRGLRVVDTPRRLDYRCKCLVVGNDLEITYERLEDALRVLLTGARFVAVNMDPVAPHQDGLSPATGGLMGALAAMTGRQPELVIGKPWPRMLVRALELSQTTVREALVVGDTLETDIQAGINIGAPTAIVLTGNTSEERLMSALIQPDYTLRDLRLLCGDQQVT